MSERIDRIYYINLDSRVDRKELIENELNRLGFTNYERYEAIKTPWFGAIGCAISHLNIVKNAKEKGYKCIMILEDDFEFLVSREEFDYNLRYFFNLNVPWEVFLLAGNVIKEIELPIQIYNMNIVKNAQTTCGYLINHTLFDEYIDLLEFAIPKLSFTKKHWVYAVDMIWKIFQNSDTWFIFKKKIGRQREGPGNTGFG